MHLHSGLVQILHGFKHPSAVLAQLHNAAHVVHRGEDVRFYKGFPGLGNGAGIRVVSGVIHLQCLPCRGDNFIHHAGSRDDQIQIKLPFQPLLDDLHVEQAQKAAAEAEAQGFTGFRLKAQGSIVEFQLFQRIPQIRILGAVRRINAAEHHGLRFPVTGQRGVRRIVVQGHGVAHCGIGDVLNGSGNVAHFPGGELLGGDGGFSAHVTQLHHGEAGAGSHHPDGVPYLHLALLNANVDNNSFVGIVIGVENQCLQRRLIVS